jgi:hypothetical protein
MNVRKRTKYSLDRIYAIQLLPSDAFIRLSRPALRVCAELPFSGELITWNARMSAGGIMSIAKVLAQRPFDAEQVHSVCNAFDGAWIFLKSTHSPLVSETMVAKTRGLLAKRIVDMATGGMRDAEALKDDALKFLHTNADTKAD